MTSNAVDFDFRSAQRSAFPSELLSRWRFQRVFLLAKPRNVSPAVETRIEEENSVNRDIVQGDFAESYRNLSYKHVMGLRWAANYCRNAEFVFKMDDDIAVDFFQFAVKVKADYGRELSAAENGGVLLGYKQLGLTPQRNAKSKWFVNRDEFAGDVYPDFLSGWAWMTSTRTAQRLVNEAQNSKEVFWIDDVWVTGILAAKIDARLLSLNSLYTVYAEHLRCCVSSQQKKDAGLLMMCDFMVGPSVGDPELIRRFGRLAVECHVEKPLICQRRKWEQSVMKTCVNINNPLFLPESPGIGEAIKI